MIKYILLALGAGVLVGYANNSFGPFVPNALVADYLFNAALVALLFVMGLVFGLDREAIAKMRRTGVRILVVPLTVAFGSVLGGLVGALILGLNVFGVMAVSGGYGWYTLAGPLTGQIFGAEWGALGFTVNFLRELLTIVGVSLWVRVDKYAAVASGGATAMDTTLPVIVHYSGSDVLIAAFSSGFVLSVLAPFTILLLASLA